MTELASRKEYELLFKLQASLGGNFNAAFKGAVNTTKQLQNSMQKLNSVTGKIEAFKKQETAVESNRQKLDKLTAEHDRLQQEISQTEQPSEKLRAAMERNEKQIAETTARIEAQEARLRTMGDELSDAGVDTARLTEENERLSKSYDRLKSNQEDLARLNSAIQKNKESISQTKAQLGGVIGTAAALGAAIYAGPVKKAAEFESQMSTVKSIVGNVSDSDIPELTKRANEMGLAYKEGANSTETAMNILAAQAKQMGATTEFTAAESGKALEYMAMAGWKANQMIGGLPGIMNLASASGEDLGAVSDIVTDALTAFQMKAEDAGRFADVLAQASSNANTNVSMMGATFQKVAPVAGALGYTVEDMSLGIGLMANASIKAEVAGTSLKTSLANMAKPTKQMKTYMDKYGISLTKSDGSMKTFREVVDNLRSSLGGLSESEQVAAATAIFGKESFAGMLAIVNASDKDFNKLSDSINNSAGAAERMAAIKLDNLEGDVTLMKSALDGLQIAIGDALLPAFRAGTKGITSFIEKLTAFINENPELIQQIVKVTAGLLAFKAATLATKLGFLELKGGILNIQKGFTLLKAMFNLASINSMGFSGTLKNVAKSVTGYFGGIGTAAGGVGRAFAGMFNGTKIGSLFSGIGGAAGGIFSKMFSGIGGMAAGAAGKLTGVFAKAGTMIAAGPLGKIGGVIGKGFGKIGTMLAPLQKLGGAILGPFGGIAGKILPVVSVIGLIIAAVQIFRDHLDDVRNLIERVFGPAGAAVFDNIVGVITNIGNTIKGIFSEGNLASARDFINGIFGEQGVAVFDTFVSIVQTVSGVFGEFISFINTSVKPVIEELFSFIVSTVLPQIASAFVAWGPTITGIIQNIWQVVQAVATAVMSVISALMPTIQSLISIGLETVKNVVSGVLTAIQGLFDVFAGVFTGDWSRVWEGVKNVFSGIWDAITGIATGALDGIKAMLNGVIDKINGLKIPDWVPLVGGKSLDIPKFARGTQRTPDTFIAGEAGAELITNARNKTVFTAAETGRIASSVRAVREGAAMVPSLQAAVIGAQDAPQTVKSSAPEQLRNIIAVAPDVNVAAGKQGAAANILERRERLQEIREATAVTAPGQIQSTQEVREIVMMAPILQAAVADMQATRMANPGIEKLPVSAMAEAAKLEIPQLQYAQVGVNAPDIAAQTVSAGQRQSSIVINSNPVFNVGSEAQAQDIEAILRKHDEELLREIDERDRQRADDERRRNYD